MTKEEFHDQTDHVKEMYEIKFSFMISQIKSFIKYQFCFNTILKSKNDSKGKKKRKFRISHYEFS